MLNSILSTLAEAAAAFASIVAEELAANAIAIAAMIAPSETLALATSLVEVA